VPFLVPGHMAKSRALEDTLERLHESREQPETPESLAELRRVLRGRYSHAAAKAAEIAGEHELHVLVPDLVAAFDRLMDDPLRTDPGCTAKAAIAEALYRMGAHEGGLFLRGVRHMQMEPVYGGRADTAGPLRGACAFGLVRIGYPDALIEVTELLADPEAPVRQMAAQALAYTESAGAVPLLRLKALIGDEEPQVLMECLLALLKIAPAPSMEFVERFLNSPTVEIAEAAALALGSSRFVEAVPVLRGWWERVREPALRRAGLLALAQRGLPSASARARASAQELATGIREVLHRVEAEPLHPIPLPLLFKDAGVADGTDSPTAPLFLEGVMVETSALHRELLVGIDHVVV
jgi:HEAT repeat protein